MTFATDPTLRLLASILALSLAASSVQALAPETDIELERLESALARWPDDPDLLKAHARALSIRGRIAEALEALNRIDAGHPERRAGIQLDMGRLLFERGDNAAALTALEAASRVDPRSSAAHFYRGLALRELGRYEEARSALDLAASLSSELEPEVLLLHSVDLLDSGDEATADALLSRVVELDPSGSAGSRARLLLFQSITPPQKRWYRLDAFSGLEWDSNVTFAPDQSFGLDDASPAAGSWGLGVALRPLQARGYGLELGYLYDQNSHTELSTYDLLSNTLWMSGHYDVLDRLRLHVESVAWDVRRDGTAFVRGIAVRPSVGWHWSARAGHSQLFVRIEYQDYAEEPVGPELERTGLTWWIGARHMLPLATSRVWASLDLRYGQTLTDGSGGQTGASYDRDALEGNLYLRALLPFAITGSARLRVGWEDYPHDNFFSVFGTTGLQDLSSREDVYGELRLSIERQIARYTRLEIAWSGSRRESNLPVFRYDRQIVGVYLRVSSE